MKYFYICGCVRKKLEKFRYEYFCKVSISENVLLFVYCMIALINTECSYFVLGITGYMQFPVRLYFVLLEGKQINKNATFHVTEKLQTTLST